METDAPGHKSGSGRIPSDNGYGGVPWCFLGSCYCGTADFFDGVTEFATGKASLKRVLAAFFLLGIAYVLCHIFNGAGNYLNEMMEKKAEGRLSFLSMKRWRR